MRKTTPILIAIIVIIIIGVVAYLGLRTPAQAPPSTTTTPTTTPPTTSTSATTATSTTPPTTSTSTSTTSTTTSVAVAPSCPQTLPDKIVIGFTVSLSGAYAHEGQMGLYGIETAVKWINDVYGGVHICGKAIPLAIKYYDDTSDKNQVASLYDRLITVDKVNFLLGPYSSPLALAAAPVAEKYGYLLMNWGGASDLINKQGYRYVVTVWTPATKYYASLLDMIKKMDPNATIAIVYADDDFDRMVANGTLTYAKQLGLNVVFYQSFPTTIQDFTPILTSLAAKHPDIILGATHYSDGLLLTQQLANLKINAKLIALTVAPSDPRYYQNLGVLAEGIAFPSQWELGVKYSPDAAKAVGAVWFGPTPDEFYRLFLNVSGGLTPSYEAASSAAAVLILVKAIETAQSLDQAAVRAALNNLTLMTFFGLFKINPATGYQIGHSMVVGQWQHGQKVIIWPPSAATASPLYPIPSWDSKFANLTKTS